MYHIDNCYSQYDAKNLYNTYEEALEAAKEDASNDYDEVYFYVTEIKSLVRADRPRSPVIVTQAQDIKVKEIAPTDSNLTIETFKIW